MAATPIVVVQPPRQGGLPLERAGVGPPIGPLPQQALNEALGLAISPRGVRPGPAMGDPEDLAGGSEDPRDVARAVVRASLSMSRYATTIRWTASGCLSRNARFTVKTPSWPPTVLARISDSLERYRPLQAVQVGIDDELSATVVSRVAGLLRMKDDGGTPFGNRPQRCPALKPHNPGERCGRLLVGPCRTYGSERCQNRERSRRWFHSRSTPQQQRRALQEKGVSAADAKRVIPDVAAKDGAEGKCGTPLGSSHEIGGNRAGPELLWVRGRVEDRVPPRRAEDASPVGRVTHGRASDGPARVRWPAALGSIRLATPRGGPPRRGGSASSGCSPPAGAPCRP
jgi:hypothetical protein